MPLSTWPLLGRLDGPHVLITGGVHGDEFEPMAALRRLGCELARLEIRGRVTLVPVVNEAAFQLGRRAASDGLDLARVCPGRIDGSITERTAHALSELIRSADFYLDLHTGGSKFRILPLSGYMRHHDPDVLARQKMMARAFGLPMIWGTTPNLEGRSLSVARDAKVPAIYVEYLGGGGCDPEGVSALNQGCLNVLADLGVIDREVARPPGEPLLVEDDRPNSGFLQIQNPAPTEGFFEPAVTLGQTVREGETLGTISDVLGRNVVPARSDKAGMVVVLHTFARVVEGDGLAAVLEVDRPPSARLDAPARVM